MGRSKTLPSFSLNSFVSPSQDGDWYKKVDYQDAKNIIREKMKLARDLLRTTNFSIGTIAAKVGFDHFSHFSMTYKKIMGVTPMEERP